MAARTAAPATPAPETVRCLRCHRALTDPTSRERGMGRVCYAREQAVREAIARLGADTDQVEWVAQALSDGAATHLFEDLVLIVATDGDDLYCTSPRACSCPAGRHGRSCKHLYLARYALSA